MDLYSQSSSFWIATDGQSHPNQAMLGGHSDAPCRTSSAGQTGPACAGPTPCALESWKATCLQPQLQDLCLSGRSLWLLARFFGHCILNSLACSPRYAKYPPGFCSFWLEFPSLPTWMSENLQKVMLFVTFWFLFLSPQKFLPRKTFTW